MSHRPPDALRALALGERRADPGPRSIVSVATIATARVTANTATPSLREAEREVRSNALEALESQRHFESLIPRSYRSRSTTRTAPVSTAAPGATRISFTAPSLGARKLVFHLHRFDDHDRLPRRHAIADGHQHADDATRHGRLDRADDAPSMPPGADRRRRTRTARPFVSLSIPPPRITWPPISTPTAPLSSRRCSRISRATPPSITDSVSASIHGRSTTRLLPLIVTVNSPDRSPARAPPSTAGRSR